MRTPVLQQLSTVASARSTAEQVTQVAVNRTASDLRELTSLPRIWGGVSGPTSSGSAGSTDGVSHRGDTGVMVHDSGTTYLVGTDTFSGVLVVVPLDVAQTDVGLAGAAE